MQKTKFLDKILGIVVYILNLDSRLDSLKILNYQNLIQPVSVMKPL